MEASTNIIPVPDTPLVEKEEKRLWIGNIDSRITEFQLIKLLQKHGQVEKFDFLFHKSGPLQGQPRGYCFITYKTREEAKSALKSLDGTLALSKHLSVKWAHQKIEDDDMSSSYTVTSGVKLPQSTNEISIATKICAIEAKLKLMEEEKNSNPRLTPPMLGVYYAQAKTNQTKQKSVSRHQPKPYQRHNKKPTKSRKW